MNAFTFIADLHFYCKHHRYFLSLSFTSPLPLFQLLYCPLSLLFRNRTQKRMNLFAFQIAICESFTQTSPRFRVEHYAQFVNYLPTILLNARLTSLVVPIFERDFEGQLSSTSRFLFLFFFIHNDISLVHFANVQSSLRGITNTFTNP